MKTTPQSILKFTIAASLAITGSAAADTFGTGADTFTVDFVTVGHAGNGNDVGGGGGSYSAPQLGGVAYEYRMGVYEVSQAMVDRATNSGLTNVTAGAWVGDQPAANVSWLEAAAFVNWLNVSTGHQAAYNLTFNGSWSMQAWAADEAWLGGVDNRFRHKDAYYFLPTEDEWYKAAYHQNDGVTANYWDYPTASNTAPDGISNANDTSYDAVIGIAYNPVGPNAVTDAGLRGSAYGTFGQGGNVWEFMESTFDGMSDEPLEDRIYRGGAWSSSPSTLRPYNFGVGANDANSVGFRVASVPEPSSALLLGAAGMVLFARRRRS